VKRPPHRSGRPGAPARAEPVDRFDGWIAGVGTAAGLRIVVGCWPRSPFGPFADVMVERADRHRVLLAPTDAVAGYVAGTYAFDEVRVVPFDLAVRGADWRVDAGPLALRFTAGGRPVLGVLLRLVPRGLATRIPWIRAAGLAARLVLPGVRTSGTAGGGRREYYAALDLRRIAGGEVRWEGADQGAIGPVEPPVRFGFGSTPAGPSVVRIVTLVRRGAVPGG
jgi:hypothetical protein